VGAGTEAGSKLGQGHELGSEGPSTREFLKPHQGITGRHGKKNQAVLPARAGARDHSETKALAKRCCRSWTSAHPVRPRGEALAAGITACFVKGRSSATIQRDHFDKATSRSRAAGQGQDQDF